ncbi:MAG TPA: NHL repeat-containing protein, partial [Vicinamibacterales bacterium]|nr:NHL repeat-containing protein [Vicinamibacterales bacterium]
SFESWRHASWRADAADAASAVVTDAAGTRYLTSEYQHQLIIERKGGERLVIGRRGSGVGELLCPRGLAVLPGASRADTRIYVCDSWNHRIQVFSGEGLPCGAFGSRGSAAGRFDVPTAITIVSPSFPDEELDSDTPDGSWLAIADRWNDRVQIFDLSGAFIAAIGGDTNVDGERAGLTRAGWPYFRVGQMPVLAQPVELSWAAPRLTVKGATGRVDRLDLALALLPDFETWRASTPADARAAAARRLLPQLQSDEALPEPIRSAVAAELADAAATRAAVWPKAS